MSGKSMSEKAKRGIAVFSKKIPEDKKNIKFDENNQPFGEPKIVAYFNSYYGMMVQHTFQCNIQMCKFEDTDFDDLWLETKLRKNIHLSNVNIGRSLSNKGLERNLRQKRAKAKASSAKRKHVLRLGRGGWSGLKRKKGFIWPQLESSYEELKGLKNPRSKLYLMGYAKINKETKMYELDDDTFQKGGALVNDCVI
ncbi:hypothetical protein L1987_85124 [Smallanthus sonchifolius]|uniref:Uncharacterized protein n=1 Tax=Smallanthus sonchifolius TaxID=185202 RepID=A0ACB8XV25_9ASTR|nr:hypothetical protein L1987_85124 [Smallanthus sonchifolius]